MDQVTGKLTLSLKAASPVRDPHLLHDAVTAATHPFLPRRTCMSKRFALK